MNPHSPFVFVTCQVGAEGALKAEMGRLWPSFRFAYSRPGFLTFKLPPDASPPDTLDLQCAFARACGLSLGKAAAGTRDELISQAQTLFQDLPINRLHVWPRDAAEPGWRDYEPGMTAEASQIAELLAAALDSKHPSPAPDPAADRLTDDANATPLGEPAPAIADASSPLLAPALPGELAGDVVLVDPEVWWIGFHRVRSIESGWPGGLFLSPLPADAVSRVYLKMQEAIAWSGFAISPGERVAEIGCSPGGASQVLLNRGAQVLGIDPAEVHPLVLGHPRFRHLRRRSKEVRRQDFIGVHWLTCDINLPPNYTLDTVEAIVTHRGVKLKGMLLTLKLLEWSMAQTIPEYLERIRSWGFQNVRTRQLHHNRREICVAVQR
ncbi:MAG: SAM-dependent methyltransferase [Planctomycetales bacterium]